MPGLAFHYENGAQLAGPNTRISGHGTEPCRATATSTTASERFAVTPGDHGCSYRRRVRSSRAASVRFPRPVLRTARARGRRGHPAGHGRPRRRVDRTDGATARGGAVSVDDPSFAVRAKDLARRYAPGEGRARSILGAGWRTLRKTRDYGRELRRQWEESGISEVGPVPYGAWRRSRAVTRFGRRAQRALAAEAVDPIGVHVIVAFAGAQTHGLARTLDSLGRQTWQHGTVTVLEICAARHHRAGRGDPRFVFRRATDAEMGSTLAAIVDEHT